MELSSRSLFTSFYAHSMNPMILEQNLLFRLISECYANVKLGTRKVTAWELKKCIH